LIWSGKVASESLRRGSLRRTSQSFGCEYTCSEILDGGRESSFNLEGEADKGYVQYDRLSIRILSNHIENSCFKRYGEKELSDSVDEEGSIIKTSKNQVDPTVISDLRPIKSTPVKGLRAVLLHGAFVFDAAKFGTVTAYVDNVREMLSFAHRLATYPPRISDEALSFSLNGAINENADDLIILRMIEDDMVNRSLKDEVEFDNHRSSLEAKVNRVCYTSLLSALHFIECFKER
jgi:hypothetical protein